MQAQWEFQRSHFKKRITYATEMNYSQMERECLAAPYACEKNNLYLCGKHFTLFSDNNALVNMLNNPKSKPPPRIERMMLRLQRYNFKTDYWYATPNALDINETKTATLADSALKQLILIISTNKWRHLEGA
ncbi:uncharacterized protein LOC130613508 [Hydractinia symbiolongicarpus]|uniref:uncharacterized protein LOC130613508 n=1 Tax=Hydractinia symbiolongicarpus TaxID=13093 RepID=UPI00254BC3E8|nr:uncharacterized protein LOC130613508 [Hydractinia symbiolongicarpus]